MTSDNWERLQAQGAQNMSGGPIKIDFTNVVSGGTPVEEGSHLVALFDAKMTTTKKGDPMLKVTWKCQEGDTDAGRQVFDQYPIMPTTWWKVKIFLEALGEDCSGEYELQPETLVGRLALIEVEHEEYQGKMQARVTAVRAVEQTAGQEELALAGGKTKRGGKSPF